MIAKENLVKFEKLVKMIVSTISQEQDIEVASIAHQTLQGLV
jgi:hypothetical protein